MKTDQHNTFRAADAFEFVDAYRSAVCDSAETIHGRMRNLGDRMDSYGRDAYGHDTTPTTLLAAYRGYEAALLFVENRIPPGVVKLDDTDPTRCEQLTPAGYVTA